MNHLQNLHNTNISFNYGISSINVDWGSQGHLVGGN